MLHALTTIQPSQKNVVTKVSLRTLFSLQFDTSFLPKYIISSIIRSGWAQKSTKNQQMVNKPWKNLKKRKRVTKKQKQKPKKQTQKSHKRARQMCKKLQKSKLIQLNWITFKNIGIYVLCNLGEAPDGFSNIVFDEKHRCGFFDNNLLELFRIKQKRALKFRGY